MARLLTVKWRVDENVILIGTFWQFNDDNLGLIRIVRRMIHRKRCPLKKELDKGKEQETQ